MQKTVPTAAQNTGRASYAVQPQPAEVQQHNTTGENEVDCASLNMMAEAIEVHTLNQSSLRAQLQGGDRHRFIACKQFKWPLFETVLRESRLEISGMQLPLRGYKPLPRR